MTTTMGPLSAAVDGARTLRLATGRQAVWGDDNGLMKPGDSRALGGLILEAVLKAILAATADPRMLRPTRVARPGPQAVVELPESGGAATTRAIGTTGPGMMDGPTEVGMGGLRRLGRPVQLPHPRQFPIARSGPTTTTRASTTTTEGRPDGTGSGGGKGPSEKLIIPSFNGEGENGELGTSARSYLRQIDAWERMTKLAPNQRALVLYQHLEGAAWINAEALNMEQLSASDGVAYLRNWVQQHYLDVEVTSVGRSLSDLFRKLKRRYNQSSATTRPSSTGCWHGWWNAAVVCRTWRQPGSTWTGRA